MVSLRNASPEAQLMHALRHSSTFEVGKVSRILALGPDVNAKMGGSPQSCFETAIRKRWREPLLIKMLEMGGDANVGFSNGSFPLFMAVNQSRTEFFETLLDHGADPNRNRLIRRVEGDTPLHEAVANQKFEFAQSLLKSGADPYRQDVRNGQIPMDRIVKRSAHEFTLLLQHYMDLPRIDLAGDVSKADLFCANEKGDTPLDNPVTWRQWDVILQKLAAHGESFSKQDLLTLMPSGDPPIKTAIEARQLGVVLKQLFEAGEWIDPESLGDYREALAQAPVLRQLLTVDTVRNTSASAFGRFMGQLPEAAQDNVANSHALMIALRRAEQGAQHSR